MIFKKINKTIVFLLFTAIFIGCKKYPEDNKFSFQTAKKRLRQHSWYFSKLYINGADSTYTHLHNILPNSTNPADINFKVSKGLTWRESSGELTLPFYPKPSSSYPNYTCSISFEKNKNVIKIGGGIIDNNSSGSVIPSTMNSIFWIIGASEVNWDIRKLTKTDFIIKSSYNNYDVEFQFVSK